MAARARVAGRARLRRPAAAPAPGTRGPGMDRPSSSNGSCGLPGLLPARTAGGARTQDRGRAPLAGFLLAAVARGPQLARPRRGAVAARQEVPPRAEPALREPG